MTNRSKLLSESEYIKHLRRDTAILAEKNRETKKRERDRNL